MRETVIGELAFVTKQWRDGSLPWCRDLIDQLIQPYPKSKDCDAVLAKQGYMAGHIEE